MEIAARYLTEHGCPLLAGPFQSEQGPKTGQQIRYFTAPWGMALEILHRPGHMPYEKETRSRLFGPLPSWQQGMTLPVTYGPDNLSRLIQS
jgi:hypothetical protein